MFHARAFSSLAELSPSQPCPSTKAAIQGLQRHSAPPLNDLFSSHLEQQARSIANTSEALGNVEASADDEPVSLRQTDLQLTERTPRGVLVYERVPVAFNNKKTETGRSPHQLKHPSTAATRVASGTITRDVRSRHGNPLYSNARTPCSSSKHAPSSAAIAHDRNLHLTQPQVLECRRAPAPPHSPARLYAHL